MSRGDNCIGTRGTPTWILQFYLSIIKQSCHDSILFSLGTSIFAFVGGRSLVA